jgi:hypothetical protein
MKSVKNLLRETRRPAPSGRFTLDGAVLNNRDPTELGSARRDEICPKLPLSAKFKKRPQAAKTFIPSASSDVKESSHFEKRFLNLVLNDVDK